MEDAALPEEMIVLILSWLPVKSLLRFTSVSKRFHSIILSDPKFAHSQFQAARDRKTSTDRLLLSVVTGPRFQSLEVDAPSFGDHSSVRDVKFPLLAPGAEVVLLGSCNGIVFLAFDDKIFYSWNPSTGFFKKLRDPPISTNGNELLYYGVGYLPVVDDYRVFVVSQDGKDEVAIFSSRADAWTTVLELDASTVFPGQGILLKDALHWVDARRGIAAFDLAQEEKHEFRTMLLPQHLDNDGAGCKYDKHLGVSAGGCLSIVFHRVSGDWVEVWVMGEYGVRDSWTKLFNFMFLAPLKELWNYNRVLVPETTSMVIRIFVHSRIRSKDGLVKILRIEKGKCSIYKTVGDSLDMIHYQESLLRIHD